MNRRNVRFEEASLPGLGADPYGGESWSALIDETDQVSLGLAKGDGPGGRSCAGRPGAQVAVAFADGEGMARVDRGTGATWPEPRGVNERWNPDGASQLELSDGWRENRSAKPAPPAKKPLVPWPTWPLPNIPEHTLGELLDDVKQKLLWARCKAACFGTECGVVNGCHCGQCSPDKNCVGGRCCEKYECCPGNCPIVPLMNLGRVIDGARLGVHWGCSKKKNRCICTDFINDDCLGAKGCACPPGMYCRQMCQTVVGNKADPPKACSQEEYEYHLTDTAQFYKKKGISFAVDTWGECVASENLKPEGNRA